MKLLNKSIRSYLIYSSFVLLISIPVFYLAIQELVAEDVDESLQAQKLELVKKMEKLDASDQRKFMETFQTDIAPGADASTKAKDTFYTINIYDTLFKEEVPYRVLVSDIRLNGSDYYLRLKSSLLDSKDLIESIVTVMVILMLLIGIGLYIINRLISKKIWQPFYTALNKLRLHQIEKNELIAFDATDIDEFTDLNNTISSLTQRNQQAYESQKEFTEHASHELQTPLAIFQGKLDLLMQTTPLNQDQAELISDLSDACQRLNNVNKTLLLLTKIENNQFPEKEIIDIQEIIERLTEQYRFQLEKKNISLQSSFGHVEDIEANKALMEILLSNLYSNAIRYSKENGFIRLLLKDNTLTFQNTGVAIPLNERNIFGRFHKESQDVQSIGLGLSISKKISDLYQYGLNYTYLEGLHSFTIRF
ncbi:MAG: HAMP domain-containing sensor histidine kinase [Flavitalea sp.]